MRNIQRHPKYKTEYCRTFHSSGFCPYGARCHFVHNTEIQIQQQRLQIQDCENYDSKINSCSNYSEGRTNNVIVAINPTFNMMVLAGLPVIPSTNFIPQLTAGSMSFTSLLCNPANHFSGKYE